MSTWELETGHFAERFQLFVILALGESIVVTGATAAGEELDAARLAAFSVAFLGTAAMWWLYFNYAAAIAQRRLELAENRTQMARDAYTYLHVVMVAGVIVAAVGDEIVIAHPDEVLHGAELVAVCAGPAIYLLAQTLFRLRMAGTLSRKRLGGAVACVAAAAVGAVAPALVLAIAAAGDHDRGDRRRAGQRARAAPRAASRRRSRRWARDSRAAPPYQRHAHHRSRARYGRHPLRRRRGARQRPSARRPRLPAARCHRDRLRVAHRSTRRTGTPRPTIRRAVARANDRARPRAFADARREGRGDGRGRRDADRRGVVGRAGTERPVLRAAASNQGTFGANEYCGSRSVGAARRRVSPDVASEPRAGGAAPGVTVPRRRTIVTVDHSTVTLRQGCVEEVLTGSRTPA